MTSHLATRPVASPLPASGRSRRLPLPLLLVVGAVAALATLIIVISQRDTHRHLRLTAVAGGLPLVHSGKPLQAEIAESLEGAFAAQKLTGIEVGIYSASSSPTDGVVIGGADAGAFTDARKQVQQYAGAQDGLAARNGYSAGVVATAVNYPAGRRGGQQACTSMVLATTGIPVSVCAWVDRDTNGFAVSNDQAPGRLASTLAAMRVDMEK